jgi:predicted ABC-type exoprotein transport system permease subunit
MVNLAKELSARETKRLGQAKAIMDNKFFLCIMVALLGASNFAANQLLGHSPDATTRWWVLGYQALSFVAQGTIGWTLWKAHKVVNRGKRKL